MQFFSSTKVQNRKNQAPVLTPLCVFCLA